MHQQPLITLEDKIEDRMKVDMLSPQQQVDRLDLSLKRALYTSGIIAMANLGAIAYGLATKDKRYVLAGSIGASVSAFTALAAVIDHSLGIYYIDNSDGPGCY